MNDVLTTVRSLLFTFSSIVIVLTFAVLQADRDVYTTALEQLEGVQQAANAMDTDQFASLFRPGPPPQLGTYQVPSLGVVFAIELAQRYVDTEPIRSRLEILNRPGFDFGRSNVERFPDEFTDVTAISVPPLIIAEPQNLREFQQLHDSALEDVAMARPQVELGQVRIELMGPSSTAYDSIANVNSVSVEQFRVLDPVDLVAGAGAGAGVACVLSAVRTSVNQKYAYMCEITSVRVDGQTWSRARVLFRTSPDPLVFDDETLAEALGIPTDRRRSFASVYPELDELSAPYQDLDFGRTARILRAQRDQAPQTVSVFGAEINVPLLALLAFPLLSLFALYIGLHLRQAERRTIDHLDPEDTSIAWVGIYPGWPNLAAVGFQMIGLPLVLLVVMRARIDDPITVVVSAVFAVPLLLQSYWNLRSLRVVRQALQARR